MDMTACTVVVGALLCNAPVATARLTLHGTPISNTVNVYRLAAPTVSPTVEPDADQQARRRTKDFIRIGALVGGAAGCALGAHASRRLNDDAHTFNCLLFAGIGAGLGALAVASSVL